jgi:hypothetical protein
MINEVGITTIHCIYSLTNRKEWKIYKLNEVSGNEEVKVMMNNNPTLNYAELVLQQRSLAYGLYRVVYILTMTDSVNVTTSISSEVDTFLKIIPSGLVLSSIKMRQPMFGGTIEITRGVNQMVEFDPFLFTYDIDEVAVIRTLNFKYSCQLFESDIEQGYPLLPNTNQTLYLTDFKTNSSLQLLEKCFNSSGNLILIKFYFYNHLLIFSKYNYQMISNFRCQMKIY